jgi:Fe-Mn family superoxide dismutase
MYNFIKTITEGKVPKELKQTELPYPKDGLGRSLSKKAIDYHYGKLYKAYVDRFNAGEGDPDFNEAGAFLHSIYFPQLRPPKGNNKPEGAISDFINQHFKDWDKFKESFKKTAMSIQGSGWVYLAKDGKIKTITNHEIKQDILVLIDWWEHAWALDYQADKEKYLDNQWKIIDWDRINIKMEGV